MPKTRPWSEIRDRMPDDPARAARREEYRRAVDDVLALARLRTELGLPEYEEDEEDEESDANGSRIESDESRYVSALRGYVTLMGGRLEINAVFPDGTMTLLPDRQWAVPDRTSDKPPGSVQDIDADEHSAEAGVLSDDDSLWNLVGIGASAETADSASEAAAPSPRRGSPAR